VGVYDIALFFVRPESYNKDGGYVEIPSTQATDLTRTWVVRTQKRILGLSRHWLAYANLFWGILSGVPWLAPILMKAGATGLTRGIYAFYSTLCHQFANRSLFLFGPKLMYSYTDLLPYAADANTYLGLRAFIGSPELGYKVAWSDRMVSLYGGIVLGGVLFAVLRRWLRSPRWALLLPMIMPIALDGTTHMISDWSGVGQGFRYHNAWLAYLTQNAFPESFYVGNELGSFNSWLRFVTGLLAGLSMTWMLYPLLDDAFRDIRQTLLERYEGRPARSRLSA
jgi:uncharacterized membrane protein